MLRVSQMLQPAATPDASSPADCHHGQKIEADARIPHPSKRCYGTDLRRPSLGQILFACSCLERRFMADSFAWHQFTLPLPAARPLMQMSTLQYLLHCTLGPSLAAQPDEHAQPQHCMQMPHQVSSVGLSDEGVGSLVDTVQGLVCWLPHASR